MPQPPISKMRATAAQKLVIDERIRARDGNLQRNLLVGVPQFCQTVGQFKKYVSKYYLMPKTPINFWEDQYCIPDGQDSSLFSMLEKPIRVVPMEGEFATIDSEPSSALPISDQAPMTTSANSPKRVTFNPTIQVFNDSSSDTDDSESDTEMEAIYEEIHNGDIGSTEAGDAPTSPKGKKRLRKCTEEGFGVIAQDDSKGSEEDQDFMEVEVKELVASPPSPPGNRSPRVIPYEQSPTPNNSKTPLEHRDDEAEVEPYVSSLPCNSPHTKRVRLSVEEISNTTLERNSHDVGFLETSSESNLMEVTPELRMESKSYGG